MPEANAAWNVQEASTPATPRRWAATHGLVALVAVLAGAAIASIAAEAFLDPTEASAPPPPPALVAGGVPTSFGAIAIGDVTRTRRHVMKHDGSGHAVERVWTTRLRVSLTVQNRLDRPVLFSPGQLRLRVAGTTVAPLRAGRRAGTLPPRSAVRTWITYLAPEGARRVALDFSDIGSERAIAIAFAAPSLRHDHQDHQEGSK